jgi:hypothetical protein
VAGPEQEMVGVHYGCPVGELHEIQLSQEHSACQWVTGRTSWASCVGTQHENWEGESHNWRPE